MTRTYGSFHRWVKRKLPEKLHQDFDRNWTKNEADLQCFVSYHLRKYLRDNHGNKWDLKNEKDMRVGRKKIRADIVVTYKDQPRYVLELKNFRRTKRLQIRAEKDIDRLTTLKTEFQTVNKIYLLYLIRKEDRGKVPKGPCGGRHGKSSFFFRIPIAV